MGKMSVPLLLFLLALAAPRAQNATTAFVNVTVIPMDRERVLEGQTVVVRGDTVVSMTPSSQIPPPSSAVVIDGRGRYLIPGLAEMHAHVPGGAATDDIDVFLRELAVASELFKDRTKFFRQGIEHMREFNTRSEK